MTMKLNLQDVTDLMDALDDWIGAVDGDEDVDKAHVERCQALLGRMIAERSRLAREAGIDPDTLDSDPDPEPDELDEINRDRAYERLIGVDD